MRKTLILTIVAALCAISCWNNPNRNRRQSSESEEPGTCEYDCEEGTSTCFIDLSYYTEEGYSLAQVLKDSLELWRECFCGDLTFTFDLEQDGTIGGFRHSVDALDYTLSFCVPYEESPDEYLNRPDADFYIRLNRLCDSHNSIHNYDGFAIVDDLWVPDEVLAFTRSDEKETVLVLINFSDRFTECALPDGQTWTDWESGEVYDEELNCPVVRPYDWRALILQD